MNVVISTFAKFHAFELAQQMQRKGLLSRLFTTYPAARTGLPREKVTSLLALEGLERASRNLLRPGHLMAKRHYLLREAYDRFVATQIPDDGEVFVGWSGCSEHAIHCASQKGMRTVVERGSSHILFQENILKEEYARYGLHPQLPSGGSIDKELREYDAADIIMVPSTFARDTFLQYGTDPHKVRVVPYGVDVSKFKPSDTPPEIFRVLYVGSMSIRKGVPYLLQAFRELNLPESELWLVGGKLPEIEDHFKKHKGSFVHFGYQPQERLPLLYQQCSVFVIASVEEGMAMVQLQALASGLPLISTTNTGGGDLIDEGSEGFVVPVRDVDAIKSRILTLYNDPARRASMGLAAAEKARTSNNWSDYGDQVHDVYRSLA